MSVNCGILRVRNRQRNREFTCYEQEEETDPRGCPEFTTSTGRIAIAATITTDVEIAVRTSPRVHSPFRGF